jgi:hypothetical protein
MLSAVVGLALDSATFTLALGDVDGDGLLNSRDALITLSYAVGLAIPGQRVLVYAPGACGTTGALAITILPDTVDVAVGQQVRLLLAGAIGGLPAGTSVNWSVGNPELAVVSAEGVLAARAAGTTTVSAALGPGITATVPVIVRARRINWYVDAARAPLASIQLGTQRYPFATPQYAFPVAQDGDTVRVAPGVHDYLSGEFCTGGYYGDSPPADGGPPASPPPELCARYGDVGRSIVLWGDTLPDGTRPVLRGNPENDQVVTLYGGVSFEMHNLVLRGFDEGLYQYEPTRKVLVQNVLFDLTGPYSYSGMTLNYGLDTLILRNVRFLGDSALSSGGNAVYASDGVGVAVLDGVVIESARYGIYLYGVDSLDVRNSRLEPSYYEALYVDGSVSGARIYLADNQFRTTYDAALYLYDVGSVISERNVYRTGGYYAGFQVYGRMYPPQPGTRFVSLADSIIAEPLAATSDYAFYVDDLDTIRVDAMVVVAPDSGFTLYPGYLYGTDIRVRDSRFTNVSGYPLYASARYVRLENTTFTGCRVSCSTTYGIEVNGYADSVALAEITGNTFTRVYRPIYAWSSGNVHRAVVTGNTMDSVTQGMLLYGDTLTVTDNVITRASQYGVYAANATNAPKPWLEVARNRIFGTGTGGYPLYVQNVDVVSQGNHYGGTYYGAYLSGSTSEGHSFAFSGDTLRADSALGGYAAYLSGLWSGSVRRSRVEGGGYGLAFQGSAGSSLVLDSTVVTGTRSYGMQLYAAATTTLTGRWNNVTSNRGYGVQVLGTGTATLTDGRFFGNGSYAVQAGSGTSVDATNNWWGDPGGPGRGVADSVTGVVTVDPYLTSDPLGVTVPAAPPTATRVADLWRSPLVSRSGSASTAGSTEPSRSRAELMAERVTQRDRVRQRGIERRAETERRRPPIR